MSEILIDVTRLLGRLLKKKLPTGIDRVSLAYVQHFGNRARAVVRCGGKSMIVLSGSGSEKLFDGLLNQTAELTRIMSPLAKNDFFRVLCGRKLADAFLVNTGHDGLEEETYLGWLRKRQIRPLFLVHDLIPVNHPEYCRPGEMHKHLSRMNNVLRFASGVITNSQTTLNELGGYAEKTGQPVPPSIAAPLAAAELPPPRSARPVVQPYFVVLGTIEPRKNHWLLLHIWRKLVERFGDNAPKLVIIGQRGWECENVVDLLERSEVIRNFVIELPACSDADLSTYLYHSQALLFPSFAEGYGMPLMEALTFGVSVIASNLPVFREIAGDIPDYLDPLDSMGWLEKIEAFSASDHPVRMAQTDRRAQFQPPSWSSHFQLVENLMEQLA